MLPIWLSFIFLHGIFADPRPLAIELVRNHDEGGMEKYASILEAVDAIVEYMCEQFPEVAPPSEEEMIIIKREFGHLISTNPDIQDEVYAGIPNKFTSMFPTISMKIAQLKAVASRKFESYNDEMKETIKDVDSLLNFHLQWPISLLLEKKMTSYEERELNDRQIEMEIKKKQDELTDLWSADDPYAYLYLTDHKIADVNKERREDKIGKERRRMRNEEFYQAKKKLKNEL